MAISRWTRGIVRSPVWYMFFGFWLAVGFMAGAGDVARDRLGTWALVLVPLLSIVEIAYWIRYRTEAAA